MMVSSLGPWLLFSTFLACTAGCLEAIHPGLGTLYLMGWGVLAEPFIDAPILEDHE